ncbi:transglycosylase domain-containing protein [Nocardiopsis alba]|uniref:transglycosylase domain-containing protein n=1 Tax=Nocardiopsis alba TaxID=53437 RepID=UPI00366D2DE4
MPDVICHGGGELSESTRGNDGTDGQRPESNTPETKDTSTEELSNQTTPRSDLPATDENQSDGNSSVEEDSGGGETPEPEFIAGASAFKTSGTFFRDRVAQTLAEQGFELGGESTEEASRDSEGASAEGETDTSDRTDKAGNDDTDTTTSSAPSAEEADDVSDGSDPDGEPTSSKGEPDEDPEKSSESDPGASETASAADEEPSSSTDDESPREEPEPSGTQTPEPLSAEEPERPEDRSTESTDAVASAASVDTDEGAEASEKDTEPAEADAGPNTLPFTPPKEDPEEEAPRTEAMPLGGPLPDQASGAERGGAEPSTPAGTEDTGPEGSEENSEAAGDGSLWPKPRRLSDYVSEEESKGDGDATSVVGAVAGAAGAAGAAAGGAGGAGGPGGPDGPKDGPEGSQEPGGGKNGKKKGKGAKKPLWWRILRVVLIVIGLMIVTGCGVFAFFYMTVEVPDAAKADAVEQGSTFYFADGETEFAYRGTDREVIDYDRMVAGGDHVVEAVISAEDRGFWDEPGVSLSGTMRAVWSTVSGEQVQGGSTVTQQMVRNYYEGVSLEQTVSRKVQEIIIAIKVDQSEDKEWVMEQYLNTIYFGRQAYGVQAAAQAYYHKDVEEITPGEAAFLAAAIQQPTRFGYADVETTPAMENRWQYVVDGMVTTGAITQEEADEMEFPAPEPERSMTGADVSGYNGYMLQEAMNELNRLGYTEDHVNRQGYKIVTTFDKDMMDAAYETVEEMVPQDILPEGVNIGVSTIDPATGEVVAFYGGHDYIANQYDSSFLGAAQAGSAFKPYVLATALEQGYGLNSTVDGRGPRDIQGSRVQNAGNSPGGVMTLTQATQVSNNLGFVELAQEVGFEEIRQTAYDVGLPEGSIDDNQLVPVMPLGATSVRPVDQASGFATFANGGVHMEAHVIREIVNQDGENERPEVEGERALKDSTAADVTYALEQVVNGGTGTAARLWDHPVAGKTGTTDGSVAAWFVGYTPQLSTAVGVYSGNNESFSIPGHNISGGGLPATMWNRYMTRAMEGYERGSFPSPEFSGNTENWAPDPATQQPQEPQEPQEPQGPQEPQEPIEPPTEPQEPQEPIEPPTEPQDPDWPPPDEPETGFPDIPPGRGEEGP